VVTIQRLFGLRDDPVAGGASFDALTTTNFPAATYPTFAVGPPPEPPDANLFWPVTGGTVDQNIDRTDRSDEVRGRRAVTAPTPFRARPVMTVPIPAYRQVVEKALRKTLGGVDTVTGTAAPYTHTIAALGFGSTQLPSVVAQLVRDDLNAKMSGGSFNRFSITLPFDGEGSVEVEIDGLYYGNYARAIPTASYTGMTETQSVLMLRDAQAFIDGSGTAIPDLQAFDFAWVNNVNPKWYARRNIDSRVIGVGGNQLTRRLWYPQENKLGGAQDVTFGFSLGNVNMAQELARDFGQIQKFVVEAYGDPIAATAATELVRFTLYGTEIVGGGAGAITARDDITSDFQGGAFYSTADAADVKVEIVNGTVAAIT
jgi:hypothetical protein